MKKMMVILMILTVCINLFSFEAMADWSTQGGEMTVTSKLPNRADYQKYYEWGFENNSTIKTNVKLHIKENGEWVYFGEPSWQESSSS